MKESDNNLLMFIMSAIIISLAVAPILEKLILRLYYGVLEYFIQENETINEYDFSVDNYSMPVDSPLFLVSSGNRGSCSV